MAHSKNSLDNVRILHLVGSVESQFLYDLSLLYCKTSWETLTPEFPNSWLAVVTPQRQWYITKTFENATSTVEPQSEEHALKTLAGMGFDCVIPHMFCTEGMTTYRQHMEDIGIKLMGNPSKVCANANHKQLTKDIVSKAGVRVPHGLFLKDISEAPQNPDFGYPCVVKPCDLDNSVGVTYCQNQEEYSKALEKVFELTSDVLVEEYIKGEEVRCAIIETKEGGLRALPTIRYILDVPIRGTAQKLILTDDKKIQGYATKPEQTECPAKLNEKSHLALVEAAKKAHEALGCQLYSLFDFRVTDTEVVMLEACLFCSFSPKSVLPTLARKENITAVEFFRNMLEIRLSR